MIQVGDHKVFEYHDVVVLEIETRHGTALVEFAAGVEEWVALDELHEPSKRTRR